MNQNEKSFDLISKLKDVETFLSAERVRQESFFTAALNDHKTWLSTFFEASVKQMDERAALIKDRRSRNENIRAQRTQRRLQLLKQKQILRQQKEQERKEAEEKRLAEALLLSRKTWEAEALLHQTNTNTNTNTSSSSSSNGKSPSIVEKKPLKKRPSDPLTRSPVGDHSPPSKRNKTNDETNDAPFSPVFASSPSSVSVGREIVPVMMMDDSTDEPLSSPSPSPSKSTDVPSTSFSENSQSLSSPFVVIDLNFDSTTSSTSSSSQSKSFTTEGEGNEKHDDLESEDKEPIVFSASFAPSPSSPLNHQPSPDAKKVLASSPSSVYSPLSKTKLSVPNGKKGSKSPRDTSSSTHTNTNPNTTNSSTAAQSTPKSHTGIISAASNFVSRLLSRPNTPKPEEVPPAQAHPSHQTPSKVISKIIDAAIVSPKDTKSHSHTKKPSPPKNLAKEEDEDHMRIRQAAMDMQRQQDEEDQKRKIVEQERKKRLAGEDEFLKKDHEVWTSPKVQFASPRSAQLEITIFDDKLDPKTPDPKSYFAAPTGGPLSSSNTSNAPSAFSKDSLTTLFKKQDALTRNFQAIKSSDPFSTPTKTSLQGQTQRTNFSPSLTAALSSPIDLSDASSGASRNGMVSASPLVALSDSPLAMFTSPIPASPQTYIITPKKPAAEGDDTESEGEDEAPKKKKHVPSWARGEKLDRQLRKQALINPDTIFGRPKDLQNLKEMLNLSC